MEYIIGLAITAILLALGFFVGGYVERRHFADLDEREQRNGAFLVTQLKSFPGAAPGGAAPVMLCGEAVISSDYLKSFLASIRKIFGGEMRSYQTLLIRARREALQRVVEEARQLGFNAVCNVRYSSTDISGASKRKKTAAMVTILATATAYHCQLTAPTAA